MKILISNDDGVESEGIRELALVMKQLGEVVVVAPHRERSTAGHSLTLHKPLRIHRVSDGFLSTSGTPADCVYLGLREVLDGPPDLILSGINRGPNLGTDVFYSGTVAAAREGALSNIKSYAFSLVDFIDSASLAHREPFHYRDAAEIAKDVILKTMHIDFPKHSLLNVNIPNKKKSEIKGIKITRQGWRYYGASIVKRTDPFGRDYFWIGGGEIGFEKVEGTDCHEVHNSFVAITPLNIDCTHNDFYTTLEKSGDFQ